ncbi:MAG: T9SS type B sorting domain-containing protein, partial [Bacteroidales bacterium]|nr:T9SS type B sorting domain-containing protein [Bacteroidales bacterium]
INEDHLNMVYWDYGDGNDTSYIYHSEYTSHEHLYSSDGSFPLFLHLTATNNCEDSATELITIHPLPQMGFMADSTIFCGDAEVIFRDTSSINSGIIANRLWTFGDGDFLAHSADTAIHQYESGVYSVSLENTSDKYCKSILTLDDYILINPIIEADFNIDPEIVSIQGASNLEINNYVTDESYFRWALSDTIIWENLYTPNIADSIFDTGKYELKMYTINQFGCIDSTSRYFEVTPVYNFYVPTGFSPNGNGTNDTFGPVGKYFDMDSYSLRIFNRWGEMIFTTNDFYEQWDGTTKNGEVAPIDTYAWIIQVTDMNGNYKLMRGAITLLL